LERIPAVDSKRLEMLVKGYQAELYRYVRYLGADVPTAEDVVQEAFLAAAKAAPSANDEPKAVSAWLRGITRNVFLMHCRRARANPVKADSELMEQAERVWTAEFLGTGDGFDYLEALRECLKTLPEKQRSVVELRYAGRKSRSEIAQLYSMTEDGVKSLLQRTRAALAECVRKRLASETAA
jgi:RNA polymerase sigma-70 factor (ECF subfamily)